MFLAMKIKKNIQSMYQNNFVEKNAHLLLIGEGEKNTMFLSKVLIRSCMIIHFIVEENIFVVIVYMLLLQCHIKDCFKINSKQTIK